MTPKQQTMSDARKEGMGLDRAKFSKTNMRMTHSMLLEFLAKMKQKIQLTH